jgi:large subunit ribosomal protein L25
MTEKSILNVVERDGSSVAKKIRESGSIVGIVYGYGLESSVSIQFDYQEFRKIYRVVGDKLLLYINLNGKEIGVIVHEFQINPVTRKCTHVDFLAIDENKLIKSDVDIVLDGLAPAVKNLNAVLFTPSKSLRIETLPVNLVKEISIDVTTLNEFEDSIKIKDLELFKSNNIKFLADENEIVVIANTPKGYAFLKDKDKTEEK